MNAPGGRGIPMAQPAPECRRQIGRNSLGAAFGSSRGKVR
jgi:hypothetical protein